MIDQDALVASLDLVKRAGAAGAEFGWADASEDADTATDWYAQAKYKGRRVIVEHHPGPVEALEALARRLLDGATCRRCARPIVLDDTRSGCRWTRSGASWRPGCGLPVNQSIPAVR